MSKPATVNQNKKAKADSIDSDQESISSEKKTVSSSSRPSSPVTNRQGSNSNPQPSPNSLPDLVPPSILPGGETIVAGNPFDDPPPPQQQLNITSSQHQQQQQKQQQLQQQIQHRNMMNKMPPPHGPQGPHPGGPHPSGPNAQKVYPPNQPMVFNPSNPNAPPIYPCGICHKEVHDNDQAILCESGCNFWFHRICTGLTEAAYQMLTHEVYAEWVCDKCLTSKNIPLVKMKP
ncbi:atrophin-1 isoform X3 [Lingula anatina]|uniref:Atrophin-1 isoform X2 n=1 Tax=Lingula anatina TaxID=7574 RepID=A0A1S3J844_LINAN|nr:atrophin-1 isoform X2 [Lingula anatina]XP_013406034.1 atrophin-1 isoform X3 [Lingula anatina]|eukprot:XP_013406033.1 atrophin-1 isoform X2 [Lingula anatina]